MKKLCIALSFCASLSTLFSCNSSSNSSRGNLSCYESEDATDFRRYQALFYSNLANYFKEVVFVIHIHDEPTTSGNVLVWKKGALAYRDSCDYYFIRMQTLNDVATTYLIGNKNDVDNAAKYIDSIYR